MGTIAGVPRDDDATLHLINPLRNPCGGSERRTIDMARTLRRRCNVAVWASRNASPALVEEAGARIINPLFARFPRRGTFVFVGTYFTVGRWIALASPARVVVIFNTDQPRWLRDNLARINACGRSGEVVYTSVGLRARHRGNGPVLESTIDVGRFPFRDPRDAPSRPFTVGRLSRDDRSKHHAEDPALYRRLAAAGIRVRLMGATCIAGELAGVDGIEILPAGAMSPLEFLRGIDCFVYRTASTWYEAFGRVVSEAMAAGVPVVCSPAGGYAHYLTPGVDALVAGDSEAMAQAVLALRDDRSMAARLAARARTEVDAVQRRAEHQLVALLAGTLPASPDAVPARGEIDDDARDAQASVEVASASGFRPGD
jgi:glycosyltransferase involved in cell wall biosynthesis